ncbi:MAG: hypothetical protein CVT64_11420 [Actinobacteria bacterium HGW-Actinobacteria-4]|nr:MAG: hypothetical protein CVT64_11420 [Actinobacteria bacterium HGW-Actinobacteria-4]
MKHSRVTSVLSTLALIVVATVPSATASPRSDDIPPAGPGFETPAPAVVTTSRSRVDIPSDLFDPERTLGRDQTREYGPELAREMARTAVVGNLIEMVSSSPSYVDGGYSEVGSDTVRVYWHGAARDPSLTSLVRKANGQGLDVEVFQIPFSTDDLARITDDVFNAAIKLEIPIGAVNVDDYERVEIVVTGEESDFAARQHELDALKAIAAAGVLDVVVTFEPGFEHFAFTSRRADTGNFDTAGAIERTADGWVYGCTTGLAFSRSGYGHYLLTAAHCADHQDGVTFKTPAGRTVGKSSWNTTLWGSTSRTNSSSGTPRLDAALISIGAGNGSTSTSMFQGTNTTTTKVSISGVAAVPSNTTMCTSGANTGYRCNFKFNYKLSSVCMYVNSSGTCVGYASVVRVKSNDGKIMFGQGDSGGPIYYNTNGKRLVVGIVQGAPSTSNVDCGSVAYNPGSKCSNNIAYITPVNSVISKLSGKNFVVRMTG